MVTETELHYRQPCYSSVRMAQQQCTQYSPTPDTVSSAADAMLKLSGVGGGSGGGSMAQQNGTADYSLYHSPKQDSNGSLYAAAPGTGEYMLSSSQSMAGSLSPQSPTCGMPASRSRSSSFSRLQRKEREFVPEYRKDNQYWLKRQKNNEAAKRSREKRRMNDMAMSDKLSHVSEEKHKVEMELEAIKRHFGLPLDKVFQSSDHSQMSPQRLSPGSSPRKALGSSTSSSPRSYDMQNGMNKVTAPPLLPLQGKLAEVIAQKMLSTLPPPLEPVPDSPPMVRSAPMYQNQYSNDSTQSQQHYSSPQHQATSPSSHQSMHHQQHHSPSHSHHHHHQQHSQHQQHMYPITQIKQQPESPPATMSPDHQQQQQFQYNSYYPVNRSPPSPPQKLHIAVSPSPPPQQPRACQQPQLNREHSSEHENRSSDVSAPLNLSKRRRMDFSDSPDEQLIMPHKTEERKDIPLKLRHKYYSSEIREAEQDPSMDRPWGHSESSMTSSYSSSTAASQSRAPSAHSSADSQRYSPSNTSQDDTAEAEPSNNHHQQNFSPEPQNDADEIDEDDTRYIERREKNNMAARKCRENRRIVNELRVMKSQVLENENEKLKDELRNLSEEVHGLKRLIERKHQSDDNGDRFEQPAFPDQVTKEESMDED